MSHKIDLEPYVDLMYNCIRRAEIHDPDVTSDIMTTVIERIGRTNSYDPERGAITTWLPWVMRSVISNYFRDRAKSTDALDQGVVPLESLSNRMDTSFDFNKEIIDLIQSSELHKKDKVMMILKWNDGFNLKEIADRFGVSHDSLRQRYSRAIKQLKEENEKETEAINREPDISTAG